MVDRPFGDRRDGGERRLNRRKFWFFKRDRRSRPDRRRGSADRRIASFDRRQFFDGWHFVFSNRRKLDYERRGRKGKWVAEVQAQEERREAQGK